MTEREREIKNILKEVTEMRRLQVLYWDTKAFTIIDRLKKQEKYVDRLLSELTPEEDTTNG